MLLIECPWCGPRAEIEYSYGGPSHVARPGPPEAVSDAEWGVYLHTRRNPKGLHLERWRHTHGCRQWFNVARDTVTHRISAVYRMGEPIPGHVAHAGQKDASKKDASKKDRGA